LSGIRISWKERAFTANSAREALVGIRDMDNFPHAAGYSRLWLFRYLGGRGWIIYQIILLADELTFETVDIEGNGRLEVWVEGS